MEIDGFEINENEYIKAVEKLRKNKFNRFEKGIFARGLTWSSCMYIIFENGKWIVFKNNSYKDDTNNKVYMEDKNIKKAADKAMGIVKFMREKGIVKGEYL